MQTRLCKKRVLKVAFTCQRSLYKTEKSREKMDLGVWRNQRGKTTNKTHVLAWNMMKLIIIILEPDCVICTFEFIITRFRFMPKQSEYIKTIRLESRVE